MKTLREKEKLLGKILRKKGEIVRKYIERKGEIARNEQFLLFPQCFSLLPVLIKFSLFLPHLKVLTTNTLDLRQS